MPTREDLIAYIDKKGPQTTAQLAAYFDRDGYGAVSQCVVNAKNAGIVENDGKGTPWRIVGVKTKSNGDSAPNRDQLAAQREAQVLELLPASTAAIEATLKWGMKVTASFITRMKAKGLIVPAEKRGGPWTKGAGKAPKKRTTKTPKVKASKRHTNGAAKPKTLADVARKHVEASVAQTPAPFVGDFVAGLMARRELALREAAAIDNLLHFYQAR